MTRLLCLSTTTTLLVLAPTLGRATDATGEARLLPRVRMSTTLGDITLELNAEKAPITVQNFLRYAKDGYYAGTIFHRVIPTFMIQGGGYTPEMDEKREGLRPGIRNEWRNGLKNVRGTIAMARLGGQPDSGTSQFFINVVDNPFLDQPQQDGAAYCVFGKVIEGMDVVDKIKSVELISHPKYPGGAVSPKTPVVINSVTLLTDYDLEQAQAELDRQEQDAAKTKQAQLEAAIARIEREVGAKFVKTASGLQYIVRKEGTGASPKPTDTVKVHYRGTLVDGQQFDSSYDRGEPIDFPLNGVIKGWTEGVGLMKVGGKSTLIIPPELGYGERGAGGVIPPNATLIFDVELLAIQGQ